MRRAKDPALYPPAPAPPPLDGFIGTMDLSNTIRGAHVNDVVNLFWRWAEHANIDEVAGVEIVDLTDTAPWILWRGHVVREPWLKSEVNDEYVCGVWWPPHTPGVKVGEFEFPTYHDHTTGLPDPITYGKVILQRTREASRDMNPVPLKRAREDDDHREEHRAEQSVHNRETAPASPTLMDMLQAVHTGKTLGMTVLILPGLRVPSDVVPPYQALYANQYLNDTTCDRWSDDLDKLWQLHGGAFRTQELRKEYTLEKQTIFDLALNLLPPLVNRMQLYPVFSRMARFIAILVTLSTGATTANAVVPAFEKQWKKGEVDFEALLTNPLGTSAADIKETVVEKSAKDIELEKLKTELATLKAAAAQQQQQQGGGAGGVNIVFDFPRGRGGGRGGARGGHQRDGGFAPAFVPRGGRGGRGGRRGGN